MEGALTLGLVQETVFLAVSKQSWIHQKVVGTFSLQLSISFQVQVQIEGELGKLLF